MHKSNSGFSLIELMIVVSIIGILTAFAVPGYRQHVLKSQRTDATSALLRIASSQEKFYIQNNRYGTYVELSSPTSERGWYTIAVGAADANTFTATATVLATGAQNGDPNCK